MKVVCGDHHVLALDANGSVFAWGCNDHGELGLGDTKSRNEPTLISFFKKQTIIDISAGSDFSVCVDELGRVYCFGYNERVFSIILFKSRVNVPCHLRLVV